MARHWKHVRPTTDLWPAATWGNMNGLTIANAPAGVYLIAATPLVKADDPTAGRQRIRVNGANISNEMPTQVHTRPDTFPLTVGYIHPAVGNLTADSDFRVTGLNGSVSASSRLDVFYLGPVG